ncbi:MAG: prephenate dehydratase [Alphaproteobacteria bacterium]|jgi:prephenate dehydratase|nr:prephenate dehydratase [Alphaproteobacteria bacterium]MDP6812443.1 prephenate dehydratase [Alphaproteobacteria bacterium]
MSDTAAADSTADPRRTVAFQGQLGAYSHLACLEGLPEFTPLPCTTFEDAFAAISEGRAARAMIAIENSLAGRVADIHHLMPTSDLYIINEHFQPVNHQFMALPGSKLADIREVHSHIHALPQCRKLIRELGIEPIVHADTAGACQMVAEKGDPGLAAIGSGLAAEIYGLEILRRDVQDEGNNVTRFIILSRERITPHPKDGDVMTTFVFQVKSVPASLYKTLGGFATAGINITKLESYIEPGSFEQAQFYADFEGHPEDERVAWALEEAQFFCTKLQILGTYPRHPFRRRKPDHYEAPHVKG